MTAPALPNTTSYTLRHVWSTGTDADTSAYDDCTQVYLTQPGIVIDGIGRAEDRAFGPPATPSLDDTLTNESGVFSPGGILGSFVGRGPATTFEATNWGADVLVDDASVLVDDPGVLVDGRISKTLFTGSITTAPQDIGRATASVQLRSLGTIAKLQRSKPTTILYESIRTDQAITVILDAAGWPADKRVLDTGDTTLLYWWLDGQTDCMTALRTILGAEGVPSIAYEDGEGVFHFEGRQFRANNRQDVRWSLFDGPRSSDNPTVDDAFSLVDDPRVLVDGPLATVLYHVVGATWQSNPDEVVRQVTTTVNVRTPTIVQKIWEFGGPLVLTSGQVLDIPVKASSGDPFKSAVTPALGTDYLVGAGSLLSVSLLTTSGQTIISRWVADAGGATINGFTSAGPQVRAVSLPITTTNPVVSTVDTSDAADRFESKDYVLSLWPEIARNSAFDLVNNFARRYQRPRDQMTIYVVNVNADHMYMILKAAVSDKLRVVATKAQIDGHFSIESMHHDLTAGGGLHRLVLNIERVTDDVPSVFGTAKFGTATFSE